MIFYTIIFINYIFIMSNMNLHTDFKKLYDSNISSLFVELYKISEPDLKLITISKWIKKVFSTINLKNFSKDSIYKKTVLEDKLNLNFLPKQKENEVCNLGITDVINYIDGLDGGIKKLPLKPVNNNYVKDTFKIKPENMNNLCLINKKYNSISKGYYGVPWLIISRLYFYFVDFRWIMNNIIYSLIKMDHKNLSDSWKKVKIFFIFKGGNNNDITRYRPLAILPTVVKLMETCITEYILNYIIKNEKISSKFQNAHLKNVNGCWERVFFINNKLFNLQKRKSSDVVLFLDLKNAFGSVNFQKLFNILKKNNYPSEFITYVENYYDNLKVEFKKTQMEWKNGLLQGSCLSNILFLIYIDDCLKEYEKLLLKITNCKYNGYHFNNIFAFVDDLTIFLNKIMNLNKILRITEVHFKDYGFTFNVKKMFYEEFQGEDLDLKMYDIQIKRADKNSRYLGQPLITNKSIVKDINSEIKEKFEKIDSLDVPNNVKNHIYHVFIYHKLMRFYEIFYTILGKEIYDNISILEEIYLSKWANKNLQKYFYYRRYTILKNVKIKLKKNLYDDLKKFFPLLDTLPMYLYCHKYKFFKFFNDAIIEKYGINFFCTEFNSLYNEESELELAFTTIFNKSDKKEVNEDIHTFQLKTIGNNEYTSGNGKNFVTSFY